MSSSWRCRSWRSALIVASFALAWFAACRDQPPPDPRFEDPSALRPHGTKKLPVVFIDGVPVPAASASSAKAAMRDRMPSRKSAANPAAPIGWDAPKAWRSVRPSNNVRMAEYQVPATEPDGVAGHVAVLYLGPAAIPAEDTLKRWASDFGEDAAPNAKSTMREEGPFRTHVLEVAGTYRPASMMSQQGKVAKPARSGWMLLGAIVQTPRGPYYFKLRGPEPLVRSAREDFLAMIDSVGRPGAAPAGSR